MLTEVFDFIIPYDSWSTESSRQVALDSGSNFWLPFDRSSCPAARIKSHQFLRPGMRSLRHVTQSSILIYFACLFPFMLSGSFDPGPELRIASPCSVLFWPLRRPELRIASSILRWVPLIIDSV